MAEPGQTSARGNPIADRARGPNHWVLLGPLLALGGSVSYFFFFVRFPVLRDFPWVNLPTMGIGLLLSAVGLCRAFDAGRTMRAKIVAGFGLLFSLALALLFSAYVFYISSQLPETDDVAQVRKSAPDFALPDQNGGLVRLSDLRGQRAVVVFYRGHW